MHKNHTFTQTKHIGNHDIQAKDKRFLKKFPNKAIWDKKNLRNAIKFFLCLSSTTRHGACCYLCVICMPSEPSLEKTNFSFVSGCQLEIAAGLGWEPVHTSFSQCWDPVCLCVLSQPVTHTICVPVLLRLEDITSLVSSIPLAFTNLLPSHMHCFLNTEETFRTECSKVCHSLLLVHLSSCGYELILWW